MKTNLKFEQISSLLPDEMKTLVPDDSELKRLKMSMSEPEVDEDERTVIGYITTSDIDRTGDLIYAAGVDVSDYRLNPVVCLNHDYTQIVGRTEWVEVTDKYVKTKTTFADTELGEEVFELVKGGFLNAYSVGIIPQTVCVNGERSFDESLKMIETACGTKYPKNKVKRIVNKCLLLEASIVTIPANANALISKVESKELKLSDSMLKNLGISEFINYDEVVEEVVDEKNEVPEIIDETIQEVEIEFEQKELNLEIPEIPKPIYKKFNISLELNKDEVINKIKSKLSGKL